MNCPNCQQPIEPTAAFCGNCGQPLQVKAPASGVVNPPLTISGGESGEKLPPSGQPSSPAVINAVQTLAAPATGPVVGASDDVPDYALTGTQQHTGEAKALLSLVFGVIGIASAFFIAIMGLGFGIAGIVMGTMSRGSSKRKLSTIGLVFSSVAILAGLGVWVYAIVHNSQQSHSQSKTANAAHQLNGPTKSASTVSTPCYSTGFVDTLNVTNASGSCDMGAFNGPTLNASSNLYKVYADQSQTATPANFNAIAKQAIDKDVQTNLPGFTTNSEQANQFAGSQAYFVSVASKAKNIAVVEAAVYHPVAAGDNVFILIHAENGTKTDLNTLEAQWQWK